MDSIEVAEVLEGAADSILVHGWGQDIEWIDNEAGVEVPYCALGHLCYATEQQFGSAALAIDAITTLQGYISVHEQTSIIAWNDTPGRTEGEVRDMFLLCAKDLRNEAIV